MGRYFNSPSSPYLGSGTYLGGGIADRNVNLGYGFPTMVPNPEFSKSNPYGIGDDQVIMNEGTPDAMIVGKDAPRGWGGVPRAFFGGIDALTNNTFLPDTDWDKRGRGRDSYGNLPKPGELGTAPVKVPEMVMSNTLGNNPQVGGSPVPGNLNMGPYLLENTGIGLGNQFLSQWQQNRALDNYYDRALQTRQAADAQDVLLSQAMQRTDKGQSERATEQQSRMLGAAQANYLRRLGIKGMSDSAATKAVGGLTRSQFGSSSPVSVLGNYKAG